MEDPVHLVRVAAQRKGDFARIRIYGERLMLRKRNG
jgi:hypothetical protein